MCKGALNSQKFKCTHAHFMDCNNLAAKPLDPLLLGYCVESQLDLVCKAVKTDESPPPGEQAVYLVQAPLGKLGYQATGQLRHPGHKKGLAANYGLLPEFESMVDFAFNADLLFKRDNYLNFNPLQK